MVLLCRTGDSWNLARHRTCAQMSGVRRDRLYFQSVLLEITLCIIENLSSSFHLGKCRMRVSWHDRSVVDEVQEPASMFGQDDLLLCALNSGCEVLVVCFLELLPSLGTVSRF